MVGQVAAAHANICFWAWAQMHLKSTPQAGIWICATRCILPPYIAILTQPSLAMNATICCAESSYLTPSASRCWGFAQERDSGPRAWFTDLGRPSWLCVMKMKMKYFIELPPKNWIYDFFEKLNIFELENNIWKQEHFL